MKQRKKTTHSATTAGHSPEAGGLKEQLKQLSIDQLAEIAEKFLARLDQKQQWEFKKLLPPVRFEDPESHIPYERDEDFLKEIKDFCERVRNEEFVEYGAGYDSDEREYHGFGDDSWIEEMDALFEAAEIYFLARHYETVEKAYRLLFGCLEIQSREGGFYFTTSDPQAALSTDVLKARKRYFESLGHLYTGETLAEKIIDGLGEYRYIGEKPPDVKQLFPDGGPVIELLEAALIKRSSHDKPDTSVTRAIDRDSCAAQYPEMARRLDQPSEFIKQLRGELFQESLSEPDRDRQVEYTIEMLRSRIDQIVTSKGAYTDAARDAQLVEELYRFQRRDDEAHSFIAGLHKRYPHHRNFRAELKKLGLGSK